MHSTVKIALRGRTPGTARFETADGALAVRFAVKGGAKPAAACFLYRDGGIFAAPLNESGACRAALNDVCAAAAYDAGGRLLCRGAIGACGGELEKRLGELNMRAAALLSSGSDSDRAARAAVAPQAQVIRPKSLNTGPQAEAVHTPAPHTGPQIDTVYDPPAAASQAARGILEAAGRLFAPLDGTNAKKAARAGADDAPVPDIGPALEAVKNPFPRTYPNSYWQRRIGDAPLYGTAQTRTGRIKLAARPALGARRLRGERYVIDVSGKGWFVREG